MAVDTQFLGQLDPNLNTQLLNAQQQVQMARALRGESLAPIQAPPGQNGVISPLSVLAKALMGYSGSKGMQEGNAALGNAESAIARARMGAMGQIAGMIGGDNGGALPVSQPQQPQQTQQTQPVEKPAPQPSIEDISNGKAPPYNPEAAPLIAMLRAGQQSGQGNQPAPAAPAATPAVVGALRNAGPVNSQTMSRAAMAEMYGFPEAAKALYGQADNRTDLTKALVNQGVVPGSPEWNQALAANVAKTNYIAPVSVAQGNVALDPRTNQPILQNPKMADGVTADFSNPLAPTASQMPGYAPANAAIVGAAKRAEADAGIRDVTLPDGRVVPMRAGAAAAAGDAQAGVGSAPTYTGHQLSAADLGKLKALADGGNNDARMLLDAHGRAYPQLGADPTIQSGRTDQQTSLKTKWDKLTADNATAQTANSYLQNIVEQAAKAAVGPQSDKIQFLNGLLSAAGISDRATDATTANNLIDKYHAQLTARLGGRSDAADAILAAGNPNSHMTGQAIRDAASNLQGANEMVKAKAALLAPHANALDPVGYSQKEILFDQNADPRLWQYKSISDQAQRAAFLKNVLKQDPHFIDKAEALHKLGAY